MKRMFLMLLLASVLFGQVAEEANRGYQTSEDRSRVGRMLGSSDRKERHRPEDLIKAMNLKPGSTVADVGTGVGFMLPYLSKAVGPSGRVLAQDIFEDFLAQAKQNAAAGGSGNISFFKGTEKDPNLPKAAADAILVLDAYHHFDYPKPMLGKLREALTREGRLIIVDYYKRPDAMSNGRAMQHIRLDVDDVILGIEANGFRLASRREHIPNSQYIAIFERTISAKHQ